MTNGHPHPTPGQKLVRWLVGLVGGAIILAGLGWGWNATINWLEIKPVTADFDPASGEFNTARFYEHQIRPPLDEICGRPNWQRWLAKTIVDQECLRLSFSPYNLEQMISRRVPYSQSADFMKQLRLFVSHHEGCLELIREDDMLTITEPASSVVLRENGQLVCP